jgi:hypothetical protein
MDFDSIISLLLLLLFFIAPTLLKRFNQKKKTAAPPQAGNLKTKTAKKLSLFEKLGDQLREYAQTLEQEAQKEKPSPENTWEHLAGEQDLPPSPEDPFEKISDTPYDAEPMTDPPVFEAASVMPERKERKGIPDPDKKRSRCDSNEMGYRSPKLSSGQLQQAIVWSEILSKPVALRQD